MKKLKKVFAVLLSVAMILGMSTTVFAVEGDEGQGTTSTPPTTEKPAATNSIETGVTNVEVGATVTAYRIVVPNYNKQGFTGYTRANGVSEQMLANPLEPKSGEITAIGQMLLDGTLDVGKDNIKGLSSTNQAVTKDDKGNNVTSYVNELGAGYWVVLVTGSAQHRVYNPMLVGVYYSVSGSSDVMATEQVNAGTEWSLVGSPSYAKSKLPDLTKTITGSTGKDTSDGNDHGNDVAIGDTVNFKIDTAIPSYTKSYKAVKVDITDQLSKGLTLTANSIKVQVGTEKDVQPKAEDGTINYTLTEGTPDRGFTISFDSKYALEHNGLQVIVTYDAVLNDDAELNFDGNTNTAALIYTNNPANKEDTKTIDDETYTYTFGIDAKFSGKGQYVTGELIKTGEGTWELTKGETGYTTPNALPGAKFGLFKATKSGEDDDAVFTKVGDEPLKEATSDDTGRLNFEGLDAGTYILQEIEAPADYSLNDKEIPVEITATYVNEGEHKGKLASYSIIVNKEATSTYTADYTKTEIDEMFTIGDNPFEIPNTKLGELPSTGGIGTIIFTVGGCLIMVVAAALYFANRRRSANSESK